MQGDVESRSSRLDRESRPPITAMPTAATAIAALGVLAHFSPFSPMYERVFDHWDDAWNPATQAVIFLLLLAWRARREFAITGQIEAQARADLAEEKQSQPEAAAA